MTDGPSTTAGTMTTTTRSREAQGYLDGVGAALADLPEEERADLLDELAGHLDELEAEGDTPLTVRLGSPQEYAAELRASAGLPPARARGRAGAVTRLRARVEPWLHRPAALTTKDFLVSLRPAWWVARGWAAAAVVLHLATSTPRWDHNVLGVPGGFLGLCAVVAAVVLSVQLGRGRLGAPGRTRHWGVAALNVGAAVAVLALLTSLADSGPSYVYVSSGPQTAAPREGVYAAGQQVWNIYPYDASGRLLHDVRLYDQNGTPLSLGLSFDPTKQQTLDSGGQQVDNAFPYRYLDPTTGRVTDPEAAPPVVAPPLLVVPTPSPSATPSASPSATPSPAATGRKR